LRARRCSIGIPGEGGTSSVVLLIKSEVLVLRLNWLGFRLIAGIMGLMNDGEEGSETKEMVVVAVELAKGGWIERPFMLRARRGEGEVMGRCNRGGSLSSVVGLAAGRAPKLVAGKLLRGMRFVGESGDEDGDGSERGEESVVDSVVVGEESADSEV